MVRRFPCLPFVAMVAACGSFEPLTRTYRGSEIGDHGAPMPSLRVVGPAMTTLGDTGWDVRLGAEGTHVEGDVDGGSAEYRIDDFLLVGQLESPWSGPVTGAPWSPRGFRAVPFGGADFLVLHVDDRRPDPDMSEGRGSLGLVGGLELQHDLRFGELYARGSAAALAVETTSMRVEVGVQSAFGGLLELFAGWRWCWIDRDREESSGFFGNHVDEVEYQVTTDGAVFGLSLRF